MWNNDVTIETEHGKEKLRMTKSFPCGCLGNTKIFYGFV